MQFPKAKPWRSDEYLDFIRANRCWICGHKGPSDPHHYGPGGGMGLKCGDQYTTPLCRPCHNYYHLKGHFHEHDRKASINEQHAAQRHYMGLWIDRAADSGD